MPRISMWSPVKGNDFQFIDKTVGEMYRISGDGILVHEYIGPTTDSTGNTDTSLTSIQDVLFLTNNNRKYNLQRCSMCSSVNKYLQKSKKAFYLLKSDCRLFRLLRRKLLNCPPTVIVAVAALVSKLPST